MTCIDFHTHAFADEIAERAIAKLSATAGLPPQANGTVGDLVQKLDAWGIDRAVLLPIATKPSQQRKINDWAMSVNSDRILAFGSVHPDAQDALDELSRIHALGFKGIKLHPDYQGFFIDDAHLFPIYEKCAQLGLIIVFHAGFDALSPDVIHAVPEASARVAARFPSLTMVLAHLGGFRRWDEVEQHLVGNNVYLDTAFIADEISDEQALRIIRRHGADKILLASDCPWHTPLQEVSMLRRLPLTDSELALIFHQNAERLLQL